MLCRYHKNPLVFISNASCDHFKSLTASGCIIEVTNNSVELPHMNINCLNAIIVGAFHKRYLYVSCVVLLSALFHIIVYQHPFRFSENILRQYYLLVPSRHSNTFLNFIVSSCFFKGVMCVLLLI